MALWGKKDSIYSPGTVTVDYANKQVIGSGTSFVAASVGDVISIGAGYTFGGAVISGITSERLMTIASTDHLNGQAISGVGYTISQKPKYTLHDSNYEEAEIYGVDIREATAALNTSYKVAHAGWVGVQTYIDMHGKLRVKSETLVAMSGITTGGGATYDAAGDAEDEKFKDTVIKITTQPTSVGVGTTDTASFTVVATSSPTSSLSYQWEYASDVGAGYTALSDDATYSGTATAGLDVTNTDASLDGYYYRVVVSADGATSVTSVGASMAVS
jgi:hypothetical protein